VHYPYRLNRLVIDLLEINSYYRCPVGSRGPDRASVTAEERKVLEQSGKIFEEEEIKSFKTKIPNLMYGIELVPV